jgi:hypothetical protein
MQVICMCQLLPEPALRIQQITGKKPRPVEACI